MSEESQSSNKRIARNTAILYIRMLLTMVISLYTSRVTLQVLGITDFGIYNVVGGIIALFAFLQGTINNASIRYITYSLGTNDEKVQKKIFGNIICVNLILSLFILIAGEILGVWFILPQLQIPAEREIAAFWVYQFSIFSSIVLMMGTPYNAAIIAHENLSAFAYISISDAVFKLLIVFIISIISYDRLIVYAILFFISQLANRILCGIYCSFHFKETQGRITFDKNLFSKIFSFSGWLLIGNIAYIGYTQGINILLNIFFGPVVNAARGLAMQANEACRQFCRNFQTAINPAIIKSYASKDLARMHNLLLQSSKYSFFILFLIILPLIYEADVVLKLWLDSVPNHTVNFLRLMLFTGLLAALSNPLDISVQATGNIRKFQITIGILLLMIIPVSYILLKYFSIQPEIVFIVHIAIESIAQMVRLRIVLPMIGMRLITYFNNVIIPILSVSSIAITISSSVYYHMSNKNIISFIIVTCVSVSSTCAAIYFIGCTQKERTFVRKTIFSVLKRLNK